jgi:hypothetical protein
MKRSLLWLLLAACSATQVKTDDPKKPEGNARRPDATVILTSDLRGYLGPCGCSENMRGGIEHGAFVLNEARREPQPVFFLDSGDALFGVKQVPDEAVPQQERKAKALAAVFKELKLDGRAHGVLDDARGEAFRKSLELPELKGPTLLGRGDFTVGVVAGRSAAELNEGAASLRTQGALFVIGLFPGPQDQASEVAPASGVDVLIAQARDEAAGESSRLLRSEPPVVQVQSKGRSLIRLDLYKGAGAKAELLRGANEKERELSAIDERVELLRAQTNTPGVDPQMRALRQQKLEELEHRRAELAQAPIVVPAGTRGLSVRFVPLEVTTGVDAPVKALVDQYDADVGQLNLAWAKAHGKDCPAAAKGEAAYVGNAACFDCHKETFAVWKASKHASAYATLQTKKKQYHLDCIGCHVTGWEHPGGVCRVDKTDGREGVGCEACHGPGSIHADDPTATNIGEGRGSSVCVKCHDKENSTHFDYETYVAQILGPGHGKPK